jgi:hypothetical protein
MPKRETKSRVWNAQALNVREKRETVKSWIASQMKGV